MKKTLLVLTITALFGIHSSQAQEMKIGGNLNSIISLGDFSDIYNPGIGLGLSFDYYFMDNLSAGVEVGYTFLSFSDGTDGSVSLTQIQAVGEFHEEIADNLELYAGLGLGVFTANPSDENGVSRTDFGLSPRIGVLYPISSSLSLDFNLNYTRVFSGETINVLFIQVQAPDYTGLGINAGIVYDL